MTLASWSNYYVIVGSSAGALIGLTSVVITLIAGRQGPGMRWSVSTFTTPTIVYLSVVLLLTAILSAPWPYLWQAAIPLGIGGGLGAAYSIFVARLMSQRVS